MTGHLCFPSGLRAASLPAPLSLPYVLHISRPVPSIHLPFNYSHVLPTYRKFHVIFHHCHVICFFFGEFCIIIILNRDIFVNHIDVNGQSSTKLVIGFSLYLQIMEVSALMHFAIVEDLAMDQEHLIRLIPGEF